MPINMTINGKAIQAKEGMSVLDAAWANGVSIPTLCHHPDLTPMGACRLCVVEVEKMRGLIASCTLPASEGMIVHTDTPKVVACLRIGTHERPGVEKHGEAFFLKLKVAIKSLLKHRQVRRHRLIDVRLVRLDDCVSALCLLGLIQLVGRHTEEPGNLLDAELLLIDKLDVDRAELQLIPLKSLLQDSGASGVLDAGLELLPLFF